MYRSRALALGCLALASCTLSTNRTLVPGQLSGTVVFESSSATPIPAVGAHVSLEGTALSVVSDSEGRFSFSDLPAATYTIDLTAASTGSGPSDTGLRLTGITLAALSGPLGGGVDLGTVQIGAFGELQGVVTQNGAQATGPTAALTGVASAGVANGAFDFKNLLPGDYALSVISPGSDGTSHVFGAVTIHVTPRAVTQAPAIELSTAPPGQIGNVSGLARQAVNTGSTPQGASVQVMSGTTTIATVDVNGSGSYATTQGVPAGVYTIVASAPKCLTVSLPAIVVPGGTVAVPPLILSEVPPPPGSGSDGGSVESADGGSVVESSTSLIESGCQQLANCGTLGVFASTADCVTQVNMALTNCSNASTALESLINCWNTTSCDGLGGGACSVLEAEFTAAASTDPACANQAPTVLSPTVFDAGPVEDAGLDAGVDAGSDAGLDAGSDAGTDAGEDAGLDAGPNPQDLALAFVTDFDTAQCGVPITPAVTVEIIGLDGGIVTDALANITVSVTPAAMLQGDQTEATMGGKVTFGNIFTTLPGTFSLVATAPGFAPVMSGPYLSVAGAPSLTLSSFTASPLMVVAGGSTTFSGTAIDQYGNPILNGVTINPPSTSGLFSALNTPSLSNGSFEIPLTTNGAPGPTTFTASTEGTVFGSVMVTFVAGSASATQSTLEPTVDNTNFIGLGGIEVVATVTDAFGNPLSGQTVTFASSNSTDTLTAMSGTTDSTGSLTTTVNSTVVETSTITATINGDTSGAFTLTMMVNFWAGEPSATTSSIQAMPAAVTADGMTSSDITVTVLDVDGNLVPSAVVSMSTNGAGSALFRQQGTTDAMGVFTTSVTLGMDGVAMVSAAVGATIETMPVTPGITLTAAVAGNPAASPGTSVCTVTAPPSLATPCLGAEPVASADGGVITIAVVVNDYSDVLLSGVSVAATAGAGLTGVTFTPQLGTTDATGLFTTQVTAAGATSGDVYLDVGAVNVGVIYITFE